MENRPNYRVFEVRPTRNATGGVGSFQGQIDMEVFVPGNDNADYASSVIETEIELTKNTPWALFGAGPVVTAAIDADGIAQNPASLLFKSGDLYVNDVIVSSASQVPPQSTMLKLVYGNRENEMSAMSKVFPYDYSPNNYNDDANVDNTQIGTVNAAGATVSANAKRVSMRRRIMHHSPDLLTNIAVTPTNVLTLKLILPLDFLFLQKDMEPLPGNTKLKLSLQVNPSLASQIPLAVSPPPPGLPASVTFNVSKIRWLLPFYTSPQGPPVSIKYSSEYYEQYASNRAITPSGTYQFSLNSGATKYVLISFSRLLGNNGVPPDPNDFIAPFAFRGAGTALTQLYVSWGGKIYPHPTYAFPRDQIKAYYDYRLLSGQLNKANMSQLTYSEWLMSPVFVFHVESEVGNVSNVLEITVDGGDDEAEMHVVALYEKRLEIEYDESARPVSTIHDKIA